MPCALPEIIGSLVDYEVHLDSGLSDGNAHVSIAATFADAAGWRAYSAHPDHVRVLEERIVPILESALRSTATDAPARFSILHSPL